MAAMDREMVLMHVRAGAGAALAWVALVGCAAASIGAGTAGPSNGAIIQVVQQTRDNLRAEPGARQQDVLFLNNAAALLNGTGDELRAKLLGADKSEAPTSLVSRYADARSLALDAKLALTRGDQEEAARLLEQSLSRYPTAAALELMLPSLGEDVVRVTSLCSQTLIVAPSDVDRLAIISGCRAVIPDSPQWISPADAAWFDAQAEGAPLEPNLEPLPKQAPEPFVPAGP
jgi:hypothetical protein